MSMLVAALVVTIRVYDVYGLPDHVRQEALRVAAATLADAGVQAAFVDCAARPAAAACRTGLADGELILRVHRLPKEGAHVLGDALVHDRGPNTIATIYATAVVERARRQGVDLPTFVGRVAAHEIGHLLLGTNRHAAQGLMKASWDVQRLGRGDWAFTREDAAAIRQRLVLQRASLIASNAPR